MLLRMAIRAGEVAEPPAPKFGLVATGKTPARMTEARARVLAALAESGDADAQSRACRARGCSTSVIDGLVADGALAAVALAPERGAAPLDPDFRPTRLNADQRAAADDLTRLVADRAFSATLLEGVTGSGKTEVYFEAVAEALRQKRQALVLLPEIALTAQFLDRFAARFGARPAEWHSGLDRAPARARLERRRRAAKRAVIVGARSALLSALRRPRPHRRRRGARGRLQAGGGRHLQRARHGGRARAVREGADRARLRDAGDRDPLQRRERTLPLAPASLSLRPGAAARHRAGRSQARRPAARPLAVAARDRRDRGGARPGASRRCCSSTAAATRRSRSAGPAAIASNAPIARPGWSSTVSRSALVCHHCGHVESRPHLCPQCHEADTLTACGPGVERLAEEAEALFPDIRTLVLSSDTPGGIETLRGQLDAAARGAYDLIIGTQLVAKGHNFPLLTFVCVVDADVGLANADPRAAERTFQLLRQATGRAGRGDKPGTRPLADLAAGASGHRGAPVRRRRAVLRAGDRAAAARRPAAVRAPRGDHHFGRGPGRGGSARSRAGARRPWLARGQKLARRAARRRSRDEDEIVLLGPAEAPIAVLRKRHRFRLAAKAPRTADLQGFLRAMLAAAPEPRGGVRVAIDVDPQSSLRIEPVRLFKGDGENEI